MIFLIHSLFTSNTRPSKSDSPPAAARCVCGVLWCCVAQTAEYVQKVAQRDRLYRAYYRVAFFGSGFEEEAVAGKEFVYVQPPRDRPHRVDNPVSLFEFAFFRIANMGEISLAFFFRS